MNKKYIIFILVLCLSLTILGCTSREAKTAVADGNEALKTNDYEVAAEKFDYALNNGYEDDKELKEKYDCLENFLEAKDNLEKNDTEAANTALKKVKADVIDGMDDSVILLQAEINVRADELSSNDASLAIIKNLIETAHFDSAEEAIKQLEKKDLSESQKKQIDILRSNMSALSSAKDQAKDEDNSQTQMTSTFSSSDAFNNAQNYIARNAATDDDYLKYQVMNSVDGPYTDDNGNKYFSVPVSESKDGRNEIDFYLKVFANGTIEEYDY